MKKLSRIWPSLAVLFGFLGVAVCAAAIFVVWSMGSWLTQANENVFNRIDKTMSTIRSRVLRAQTRVQESRITTEDIGEKVRSLGGREASERLAARLELEERTERLALGVQQAELWLELSEGSIRGVQQALELGRSLGAPVDITLVDPLLEQLATLRRQMNQVATMVDGILRRLSHADQGEGLEEWTAQVVRLVLRVVATFGELDPRLGESAEKVADAQIEARRFESRTHSYIVSAAVGAGLLIAWMMAGQVSLCRHGWKGFRRGQSAA
jgi:hypothetical protein